MRCAYNCSWWNHVANCCSDDCIVYSLCATGCGDGCSNGCAVLLELALPQLQEQIDCNDVATCKCATIAATVSRLRSGGLAQW